MESKHQIARQRLLIFTALWGLILAKCYILEYWVRIYSVPINSAVYVWSLTLLMAAFATYLRINRSAADRKDAPDLPEVSARVKWIAMTGLTAIFATAALGWSFGPLAGKSLQPLFAIILAAVYVAIGLSEPNKRFLAGGVTWFVCGALLFLLPPTLTLLAFGCMILILVVLPACLRLAHHWQLANKITLKS
ncbi:MAG: hypothetical protein ACPGKS_02375 [Coraliomargarita sp.]